MRSHDNNDYDLDIRYALNNILMDLKTQDTEKLQTMSDMLADMEKLPLYILKEKSRLLHIEARRGPQFQSDMTKVDAKAFKASRCDLERLKQIADVMDRLYSSEWFYRLVMNLKDVDDLIGEAPKEKQLAACDIFIWSMSLPKKQLGQMEHIFRRCKYDNLFFKAIVFLLNAPDKAIRIIIKRFGH